MDVESKNPRILRLTPLGDILALIEKRVAACAPQESSPEAARDFTLAENVVPPRCPPSAIALCDGFPVDSASVADAGPYAPVPLPPTTRRIDFGERLPSGTDAVLPLDSVMLRGHQVEAIATVAAGEGVLPAGGDATPQQPLRRAGESIRAVDIAVMRAAGIREVTVRRPRVDVALASDVPSPALDAALMTIMRVAGEAGSVATGRSIGLESSLDDPESDAVISVGGTGNGQRDAAIHALSKLGRLEAHGIAISPGETAAFGFVGTRPVLLVPGRIDAALAVWLLIGRHLVAALAGGSLADRSAMLPLKRKVTSTIGLTELVPVRCSDGMVEPLASGYLSFESLSCADGWIAVADDSEGFAAGTPVAVRPWP